MRSWTALLALIGVACTHGVTVERVQTNTYRIRCGEASLDKCLAEAANNACARRAYFVERGLSDVNLKGSTQTPVVAESSQAIIRCGPDTGWGEEGKALMAEPAPRAAAQAPPRPAAAAVAPKPAPVCAPGSTQACVGVAGCAGGQACVADGSGYSPCDCGPAPPASAP
jgi:hypothetical protein